MMAMTLAKIGCSMKNFDMRSALPDRHPPAASEHRAGRFGLLHLGANLAAGNRPQQAVDDDPLVALQALVDHPHRV